MPSNKAKGSKAERELLGLFTEYGWRAVRVAGSGVNDNSPCDLLAGKLGKKGFVVEAKSSKKPIIYITKQQIEDFVLFANTIGLQPVIAARFNYEGWLFISPHQLRDTGTNWALSLKDAKLNGKRFGQFFEESNQHTEFH
ncbi:MAG TPA: Holliday junction resolvase Hjc [Candidatus Nanoarchaeia archaeon]|nr:Holliday junction resolvase Hjc [Candidatus Nanoarchaeia archaeon]